VPRYRSDLGVLIRAVRAARAQKEYVTVPAELLVKTDELAPYFRVSFDYAKTLKSKATKRAPRS
jgi:hypothetical protein